LKLAVLAPLAIDTLVMFVASVVSRKCTPDGAVDVVDNSTVCTLVAVAKLLYASSSCTVIVLEVVPAVSVCADDVYTSWLAAAAFTFSVAVAVVMPVSDAVSPVPATTVSLSLKLAGLPPLAIVTLVMFVASLVSRKCTPDGADDVVVRFTVCVLVAVARL